MSLDSLANVKARLGITTNSDDALLNLLGESAEAFISRYCERDFSGGTFIELFPGNSEFLHLKNYPVLAVTDVRVDAQRTFGSDTLLPTDRYVIHSERGVIQSTGGPFLPLAARGLVNAERSQWMRCPAMVRVEYTTSTDAVTADVKEAYARLVAHAYRRVKTEASTNFINIAQQKFGDTFSIYARDVERGIPQEVLQLLNPHRSR